MALQLKVSNSLKQLADNLCDNLKNRRLSVFQSNFIVTQTEGMNNWLKLQIAEKIGISANCRFLKPNDIIHQVFFLLGGQNNDPLSAQNQSWLLYKLLEENDFTERFKSVSQYYKLDGSDKDLKRMALAEKIADLFDQYQVYRPEMISQWNREQLQDVNRDEWQKFLWIKARQVSHDRLPDKTFIGNYILTALKDPMQQERLKMKMPAVHVFGLSVITGFHIELFQAIGQVIDFSFHLLNPAPSIYWLEDRSEKQLTLLKKRGFMDVSETSTGNALLTSWGKVIQTTFALLFQYDQFINLYEEIPVEEPLEDSLLRKIQGDIFHNRSDDERRSLSSMDVEDGSIVISSCYTIAREVEVLYNYLVHLVDQRAEQLSPRDIVVMVSEIDAYAPYIKAVFDNAPYKFPYHIADESYTSDDNIASALKSVLNLNSRNFNAENVLQLLDYSYIRNRFGISDLTLIRKVVNAANIRFGMEGARDDESVYVSWKYGLDRIMFGICMSGDDEYMLDDDSLFPLDLTEGAESVEIIKFCHFVQVLMASISEREKPKSLTDWVVYIERLLHNLMVDADDNIEEDYAVLLKELQKYSKLKDLLHDELSYEVFSYHFLQSVGGVSRTGSFAAGGITFCSLIPMRSIPFKVVGLLGLNFDKFPRKESPVSFNLMEKEKRRGDRNIKENDKHLFLETLLSAQKYLYISYIGQSVKDNTSLPPSAMVDELLDYIQSRCDDETQVADHLITRHPLHNFSRKYRKGSPKLFSYLDDLKGGERVSVAADTNPTTFDFKEINIEDLIRFLKHPVEGYFNRVLGVYYRNEDVLLNETELFELDGLQNWKLKQELLTSGADELPLLRNKLVKTGKLPLKNMADVTLSTLDAEVAGVRDLLYELAAQNERQSFQLDLSLPDIGTILRGTIKDIYGDKLIIVSWSGSECKYLLEAYIKYLALRATGLPVAVFYLSGKKENVYRGAEMARESALTQLKGLVNLYKQAHSTMLAFYTGLPIEPKDLDTLDADKFRAIVDKKLGDKRHPSTDPYLVQKYRSGFFHEDIAFDHYRLCADLLLKPLATVFPDYYENN